MYSITRDGKHGRLQGKVDQAFLELSRSMPGRRRWVGRDLVFEMTAGNIEHIKSKLPDAVWNTDVIEDVKALEQFRLVEETSRQIKHQELPPEAYTFSFKTTPFEHQRRAFFISRSLALYAYFMEMGTGKTKVMIDKAAFLWSTGLINAFLVHAPNGVHRQWIVEQCPTHMPDFVKWKGFVYDSNTFKQRKVQKEWAEFLAFDGMKVLAMNIECMSHKSGVDVCTDFLLATKPFWAIDESTRIKTPGATRTKAVHRLSKHAPYRAIASGAPVTKGVEDLYAQLKFLSPDILGFSSFYTFRNRYCIMGGFEGKMIVGYRNVEELLKRLDGHSFRVTKADCLDLPEKVYTTREVPLTPEQKRLILQMKEEFLAQLDDGTVIDAPLAITRLMKMQQLTCGHILDAEGNITRVPSNRISVLMEILEEAQGSVIIWARFHEDIRMITEALTAAGKDYVEYHGKISSEGREAAKQAFMKGHVQYMVGNQGAGGIGLNMVVANTMVYYSNDFNADVRWQSEDRIHRIGQTKSCLYVDLVSPGTPDVKIVKALRHKKNVADSIMDVKDLLASMDEPIPPGELAPSA